MTIKSCLRIYFHLVNCVLLPVLDVYCPNAAHQEFQFALVENLEQVELNQLVETLQESLHLVVNPETERKLP